MIGMNFSVPPFIGAGAKVVSQQAAGMVSPGMRGGLGYARLMAPNWHRFPVSGKATGTGVWVDVEFQVHEFTSKMQAMAQSMTNLSPLMEQVCIFLKDKIVRRIRDTLRNTPRGTKHGGGVAQTGSLSTGWSHLVAVQGKDVTGTIGTRTKYARIHEFGGKITPKRKQALTIPFPGNVAAYPPAHDLMKTGLTFIKKDIIYFKPNKGIKPIPIYILKKSVNIPARPFVGWVFTVYGPKVGELFGKHVRMSIDTPGGSVNI